MSWLKKITAKWIPEEMFSPVLGLLCFQMLAYMGTKLLIRQSYHYHLESQWDRQIPFLPWTVVIYLGAFLYWVVSVLLIVRGDRELALRCLAAHGLCMVTVAVVFVVFPTTNTRPELTVTNFWEWGMHMVYLVDTPENLFPSLHCEMSWLCFRGVAKEKTVPKAYSIFAGIFTVMICISTLTTKQHVLADVFGGIFLAEVFYQLCRSRRITQFYYRLFHK